jgi:GNAT superfamily N-acetyltransferase
MPSVRVATTADIPAYMDLAAAFVATTPVSHIIPFDRKGTAAFVTASLDNPNMLVLVAEEADTIVGITGALAYPMYFNPGKLVAQELWWYLTPDARGGSTSKLLFQTIENWAKDIGAEAMFMIALADARVDTMAKVYKRSGYAPVERTYVKGLM